MQRPGAATFLSPFEHSCEAALPWIEVRLRRWVVLATGMFAAPEETKEKGIASRVSCGRVLA